MEESKNLLLRGVMTYGLAVGIYWVMKYIFLIFSASVPPLSLVYWLLMFAVPFIAYYMTKRYRYDIGGRINFFHAWRSDTVLYFFAALIVSPRYFVFYRFIAPPGFVANAIRQLTTMLEDSRVSSEMIDLLSRIRISSVHMTTQGIFSDAFYGIIPSIPVAAPLCRNSSTGSVTEDH